MYRTPVTHCTFTVLSNVQSGLTLAVHIKCFKVTHSFYMGGKNFSHLPIVIGCIISNVYNTELVLYLFGDFHDHL